MNPLKTLDQALVRPLLKPLLGAQMQGQVTRGANGRGVGVIAAASAGPGVQWVKVRGQLYYRRHGERSWHLYSPAPVATSRMYRPLQGLPAEDYKTIGEVPVHLRGLVTVAGAETPVMAARMVGSTNPSFVAPSATDVSNNPPGQTLADAAVALLSQFSASGVPSEHAYNQAVYDFQVAWNNDPLSQVNANGALSTDGGYGPNTHDALASISGGSAPAINTAPAPAGAPTGPSTTTTTTTTTTNNVMPVWGQWLIGAAVVGGAVVVGGALAKKHGPAAMRHARTAHARLRHHARRLAHRHA